MTNKELAAALRRCGRVSGPDDCVACPFYKGDDPALCIPTMTAACADALANSETHVAALQQEIEKLRGQIILQNDELLKLREQVPQWTPERCAELAKADKDGRLVVLPAKEVYELTWDAGPDCDLMCPVSIDGNECCDMCGKGVPCLYSRECKPEHICRIGHDIFLTREEAEQALKEAKDDGEVH